LNAFGFLNIFDHDFMVFPQKAGGILHLPCGTVPTALVEFPGDRTDVVITGSAGKPMVFGIALTAIEVQAVFSQGSQKLNRTDAEGPTEVIPFPPS